MAVVILFICFVFIFFTVASRLQKKATGGLRASLVVSILFFSLLIAWGTELLSAFDLIREKHALVFWMMILLLSGIAWWRSGKYIPTIKISRTDIHFYSVSVTFILWITLLTACIAYPNNWDSMTYHIARTMHWMQNKNVAPFPTQIDRQVTQPPFCEYIFLHIKILSGGDRMLNLVQWSFFAGCIALVSLMVRAAGGNKKTQWLAALFCATIPMAILQSNSTQNDLVEAFFITAAIFFLLLCVKFGWSNSHISGFYFATALALLTKGTALIYLLPVVPLFGILLIRKLKFRSLSYLLFGCVIVLITIGPFWWRNYQVYQNPLGRNYELNNAAYGVAPAISNMTKNTAMHLRTPVPAINRGITNAVVSINRLIGVDTQSPKYNWAPSPDFEVGYFSAQEDSAGNFFQVILLLFCFILLFNKKFRSDRFWLWGMTLLFLMFVFFCAILKWQVWHVRLHLPLFIFGSTLMAMVVAQWSNKIQMIIAGIMTVFSLVFLFFNQSRPWVGNENIFNASSTQQYFKNHPDLVQPFTAISALLQKNDCYRTGYISSGDSWEYPWYVMNKNIPGFSLVNLSPDNPTKSLENNPWFNPMPPDAIIVNRSQPPGNEIMHQGTEYHLIYRNGIWSLYLKKNNF